jgi:hypothetical protein
MTETIKVEVEETLARRFRKRAMEKYGYKKGAVKAALEDLMMQFSATTKDVTAPADWSFLRGCLKEEYDGMTSVELQHSLWRRKIIDSNRHKRVS